MESLLTWHQAENATLPESPRVPMERADCLQLRWRLVGVAVGALSGSITGGLAVWVGMLLAGTATGRLLGIPLVAFGCLAPFLGAAAVMIVTAPSAAAGRRNSDHTTGVPNRTRSAGLSSQEQYLIDAGWPFQTLPLSRWGSSSEPLASATVEGRRG